MRYAAFAAFAALLLAACQQAPSESTFDGARVADAAAVRAHGERLTYVLGCRGCHGKDLAGTFFTKAQPQYGPLYASNLTIEVPEYSDAQLDRIIRHGSHPERKTVWGMPSEIFQNLNDADYNALAAYLRTLKPVGEKLPPPHFSVQDRKDIASGLYQPAVQRVANFKRKQTVDLGPRYALGRYIASVSCEECHGSDLGGVTTGPEKTPDLIVVGGYTHAGFEKLITQGVPTPARKLNPMMYYVAIGRFTRLTPHERDALYAYLKARADKLSR